MRRTVQACYRIAESFRRVPAGLQAPHDRHGRRRARAREAGPARPGPPKVSWPGMSRGGTAARIRR